MSTERDTFSEALKAWGPEAGAGPPRPGPHDHEVRSVRVNGLDCIGRQETSSCPRVSLDWELDLLEFLSGLGVPVPRLVQTASGGRHHNGLVVTLKVPGHHPSSVRDWQLVRRQLETIHALTRGYSERPGSPDQVIRTCVTVGRVRRRDIAMSQEGPVFVDWSMAMLGAPARDLDSLP